MQPSPAVGVTVSSCTRDGLRYWAVQADLGAGDLGIRVARPSERGLDAATWAAGIAGAVAIAPGAEFDFPAYRPIGLTVGSGEVWSDTRDDGVLGLIGFDNRGVAVFAAPEQLVPAESWMHDVVSGRVVLRDGVPTSDCVDRGCERRARTGLGLSADARSLAMVVSMDGVTNTELGTLLAASGAHHGLCTGDGATSTLRIGDTMAVQSSDGMARPTAAHLAVVERAGGVLGDIRGVIRDFETNAPVAGATFSIESLSGEVVASGSVRTADAFWQANVPVRLYRVRGAAPGYRTACKICQGEPVGEVWCSVFPQRGEGRVDCEPEPRVLEVGPWPLAPDGGGIADAGPDAGGPAGRSGGCAVAEGRTGAAAGLLLVLVVWASRRSEGPC